MTSQKKTFSFEESIQKLQECVEKMDTEETSLEESIDLYEQCVTYHRQCADLLSRAKQRVEMYRPETGEIAEYGEKL